MQCNHDPAHVFKQWLLSRSRRFFSEDRPSSTKMRLINIKTFEIKELIGTTTPPYAILSHTWGDAELTFQDMLDPAAARSKAGFAKVERCCQQALIDGLEWAWVDTCCIDKTSSAELSETINSMYKFYEQAMKCYAFLSDISSAQMVEWQQTTTSADDHKHQDSVITPEQLAQYPIFSSRWWSRGWTLQELIAPYDVEFYSQEWTYLTCKQACKRFINRKYGIWLTILDHSVPLAQCVSRSVCNGHAAATQPGKRIWHTVCSVSSAYTCPSSMGRDHELSSASKNKSSARSKTTPYFSGAYGRQRAWFIFILKKYKSLRNPHVQVFHKPRWAASLRPPHATSATTCRGPTGSASVLICPSWGSHCSSPSRATS